MYWDRRTGGQPSEMQEGHANAGATRTGKVWMVPEGSTGGGFQTFVLVANAESVDSRLQVTFMTEGGTARTLEFNLPADSRITINLSDWVPGFFGVATLIQSETEVVERSMYWDMRTASSACEAMGGHCASGMDP